MLLASTDTEQDYIRSRVDVKMSVATPIVTIVTFVIIITIITPPRQKGCPSPASA